MSCLSKLLLHELWAMAKTIARTIYNRCKAVHLFVEEAGLLFEEVLHIHPTC